MRTLIFKSEIFFIIFLVLFRKDKNESSGMNESSLAYRLCRSCDSYLEVWKDALETSEKCQDNQVSTESK